MLSTRKAAVVWLALAFQRVLTAQTPLSSHPPWGFDPQLKNDLGQWDLGKAPVANATGHLVFDAANSLIQHWANTHYHRHTIVLGAVPVGTLLWHLTLTVTRPMKVLYFDGSSAMKLLEGTMDTPRSRGVVGNETQLETWREWLCEVVSFLHLESTRLGVGAPTDLPEESITMQHAFEVMHSASWRENHPGETQIILDFSGLVSFYDTALVPSLVPRRVGLERWDHRVGGISSEDIERVQDRLADALPPGNDAVPFELDVGRQSTFDHAQQVQRQMHTLPLDTSDTANAINSWAAPIFRACATLHAAAIVALGTTLTPSERLLLQAVRETTHES
ncbi:hypothetical protein EDD22DRAFT_856019 [Suillus occidentalis]|nr:hypothetical protein EDD22DRAFT_856019 [Suillus occidentalis]